MRACNHYEDASSATGILIMDSHCHLRTMEAALCCMQSSTLLLNSYHAPQFCTSVSRACRQKARQRGQVNCWPSSVEHEHAHLPRWQVHAGSALQRFGSCPSPCRRRCSRSRRRRRSCRCGQDEICTHICCCLAARLLRSGYCMAKLCLSQQATPTSAHQAPQLPASLCRACRQEERPRGSTQVWGMLVWTGHAAAHVRSRSFCRSTNHARTACWHQVNMLASPCTRRRSSSRRCRTSCRCRQGRTRGMRKGLAADANS